MLKIADRVFESRLIIGTARFPNDKIRTEAIKASGAEVATVAIRRVNLRNPSQDHILSSLPPALFLLPNTAGCYTAREAILTAELAREALGTPWIKLEVIGDEKTLLPNGVELLRAAEDLVNKGFVVLPYCTDDLMLCRQLVDVGCAAVMPLGSPIGSGQGILNPYQLRILREQIAVPIILDAGIGSPSDVATAMELGLDAVMIGTAIAEAQDAVMMAKAMNLACQAGRYAYLAGRIPKRLYAQASSPINNKVMS